MLNPAYRYVSLDFETTGLDTQKDHIIQVGVLCFDHTGNIVDEFVSLVKPENYESMTTMTAYIT
jgi:DNA polymerase III epsilon subunit-like protein